jgi:hypothetical protein
MTEAGPSLKPDRGRLLPLVDFLRGNDIEPKVEFIQQGDEFGL